MKKGKILSLIIISIFLIVLYVPFISFKFLNKYLSEDNSENRVLASKPVFDITNLETMVNYPKLFDAYWSDNLPYRNILKQINTSIDYNIFGVSSDNRVIVGKNDGKSENTWLFYNQVSDGNPMGDAIGNKAFSNNELKLMKENIENQTIKLKNKNIDLFYLIIPNKSTVYRDKLPNNIKIYSSETRSQKAVNYFNNNGINNIKYIYDELYEGRNEVDTFYHLDTHWNKFGAFIGANSIMKMIDDEFKYFDNYKITNDKFIDRPGDLYNFMNLSVKMYDKEIRVENKYLINYNISEENKIATYSGDKFVYNKKIMIIGDSFREALVPNLVGIYKKVISLHMHYYNDEVIDMYKPDIVIVMRPERYSEKVLNFEF